jgi:hypothetical protein
MVTGFGNGGFIDKIWGVGSRRGRTNRHEIHSGDVLDFGVFYMLIKKKETSSIRRNETTWTGVARIQNNQ